MEIGANLRNLWIDPEMKQLSRLEQHVLSGVFVHRFAPI
jgi:hypothetical protein